MNKNSEIFCEVNLKGNTEWQDFQYTTITGMCPHYKSTLIICPCACTAAQRKIINIKYPTHAHPRYLIGHYPLWPIAISDLALSDYEDALWSWHICVAPASVLTNPIANNSSEEYAILRARTQIYDSLGCGSTYCRC